MCIDRQTHTHPETHTYTYTQSPRDTDTPKDTQTYIHSFFCVAYPLDVNTHKEVLTGLMGYLHLMMCKIRFGLLDV